MRLVILGDIHGHFEAIWHSYEREHPDAILHVGDLAEQERGERRFDVGRYPDTLPPVPFIWVLGNHERLDKYEQVGRPLGFFGTADLDGLKVVGVGGIPGRKRPVHWGVNRALEQLAAMRHAHILLSHKTCAPFLHTRRGRDLGSPDLREHCDRIRPRFHFSGHHHHAQVEAFGGVQHVRLPYAWRGYAVYEDGGVRMVQGLADGAPDRPPSPPALSRQGNDDTARVDYPP